MKTFIIVRDSDQAVVHVGMVYKESGGFTDGMAALIDEHGSEDAGLLAHANAIKPTGTTARIVDTADLPGGDGGPNFDKLFYHVNGQDENGVPFEHCGWTDANPGQQVDVEMAAAKEIAHLHRRADRQNKMAPLDKEEGYASTPQQRKDAILVEKQAILDDNAAMQTAIDGAVDDVELRGVLETAGAIQA